MRQRARVCGGPGARRRFTRTDGRDQLDPKRTAEIDRSTTGLRRTAPMTSAMTSPPAATARRRGRLGRRTLAGERRCFGTNGGHQRVADGTTDSPATKATAEDQRTATATRRKRRQTSGRRRRRGSGGLRRRRRGGRGRRRLGDHADVLPE